VAIEGATLGEAVERLREHLNRLLARTVTETPLITFEREPGKRSLYLGFRHRGRPTQAPLQSPRFGPMGLYLGQRLESETTPDDRHRLYTAEYGYTLTPEGASEPLLRWEYIRRWPTPEARWCRHHLQGPVRLETGRQPVSLNDWHLPTGYVPIEDVLRFCIVDLGVAPLSERWHEELEESYRRFRTEFAR